MAGYFDYLGKIFTEKGAWYKILMIFALQGIAVLFNPKVVIQQSHPGIITDVNIPGIILYVLVFMLVSGYEMQVYHSSMNNKNNLLPDIDFMDMLAKCVRGIPFWLVWSIYLFVVAIVFIIIMLSAHLGTPAQANASWYICFASCVLLGCIMKFMVLPVLFAIYAKSFVFQYALNPLTIFRVFPLVIGPMLLLGLIYALLVCVLFGLMTAGLVMLKTSFEGNVSSMLLAKICLISVFICLNIVCYYAYSLRVTDIVKTRLADTEYLDSDYDYDTTGSEDDKSDSDDSLDY